LFSKKHRKCRGGKRGRRSRWAEDDYETIGREGKGERFMHR